jgi:hypothetical protein
MLAGLALAASVAAQTKISGTLQCPQPDPAYAIPVGDRPDHAFGIAKIKCTWLKPIEIAGVQAKDHEVTAFREVTGNRARNRSAAVSTLANGDRVFANAQGSGNMREGLPQTLEGTWTYTGGTGKFKGIKGKGTLKGKAAPDGMFQVQLEGEYQLP